MRMFWNWWSKANFFLGKESKEDKERIMKIESELQGLRTERDTKNMLDKAKSNKDKILSESQGYKNTLTTSRLDKYRNYERLQP